MAHVLLQCAAANGHNAALRYIPVLALELNDDNRDDLDRIFRDAPRLIEQACIGNLSEIATLGLGPHMLAFFNVHAAVGGFEEPFLKLNPAGKFVALQAAAKVGGRVAVRMMLTHIMRTINSQQLDEAVNAQITEKMNEVLKNASTSGSPVIEEILLLAKSKISQNGLMSAAIEAAGSGFDHILQEIINYYSDFHLEYIAHFSRLTETSNPLQDEYNQFFLNEIPLKLWTPQFSQQESEQKASPSTETTPRTEQKVSSEIKKPS